MATPLSEGEQKEERKITALVDKVRDMDCEQAFAELRDYLSSYISLFERKYKIPGHDADEIEQECLYALRFKAIEDFNPLRGKFRSFAILCMKRHLFSIIKASSQQKRRVLNESLSLNEDRSEGDDLSLDTLITKGDLSAVQQMEKEEIASATKKRLLSRLSKLEQEVFKLYIQQFSYEEIVEELKVRFPNKKWSKKSCDNALVRIRTKSRSISLADDFFEEK